MRLIFFSLLFFMALSTVGQTINIRKERSKDDIEVISGSYSIWFNRADIAAGIARIDSLQKTNDADLLKLIKDGSLKSVNLKETSGENKRFVELLNSNLCVYLLLKGKASVSTGGRFLSKILAEDSPPLVELDNTMRLPFLFTDEQTEKVIFNGFINDKLKRIM